jgi:tRNA threonylcarbamoyladenosine biosynthesis protein TsaE
VAESFLHHVASEAETAALGAALARVLPPGIVVALDGTLGAGKTRLVQAVAEAAGIDRREVTSPTFTLIHEYDGATPIYHFDAYRLRDEAEFRGLGADEYFGGTGWSFVEWAGKVAPSLPADRLEIRIEVTGPTTRRFEFLPHGAAACAAVAALAQRLGGGAFEK